MRQCSTPSRLQRYGVQSPAGTQVYDQPSCSRVGSPGPADKSSLRTFRLPIVVLAFALAAAHEVSAQTLTLSLFERYLETLRVQAGIPGLSAAILQNGVVVWERGLGRQDVEGRIPATPDTPYAIGGMSQALSSTLLLGKCIDQSYLSTLDPVQNWFAAFDEPQTLIGHLLAHAAPGGGFKYDSGRFASLTPVIENCTSTTYSELLANDLFEPLAMFSSVPGATLAAPTTADAELFASPQLTRFADVVRRTAIPYRVIAGKATKSDVAPAPISAATGVITTVRDLARFDLALRNHLLLTPPTRQAAWTNVTVGGAVLPTGLGWFVQNADGQPVVWSFGVVKDAWSSLILKLPNQDMTFILLANSDGLSAPFALENGDVTTSVFAKLFLKAFTP
jgi:CubicO group peptidase (beta-lactamase class C family)